MKKGFLLRNFFNEVPADVLQRYFVDRGYLEEDSDDLGSTKLSEILESLPQEQKNASITDFRDMYDLFSEQGDRAIIDAAQTLELENLEQFQRNLMSIDSTQGRVVDTFLQFPNVFRRALDLTRIDDYPLATWKKRTNLGHFAPRTDEVSLKGFGDAISDYFTKKQARGQRNQIEYFQRKGSDYFLVYLDDLAKKMQSWDQQKRGFVKHRPVIELIFVYNRNEGSVDFWAEKVGVVSKTMFRLFAEYILGLEGLPPAAPGAVYSIQQFKQNDDNNIILNPAYGIRSFSICELRFKNPSINTSEVVVKSSMGNKAIYDELEVILPKDIRSGYQVTAVRFSVFSESGRYQKAARRFMVKNPDECTLGYNEFDDKLRQILRDSGIEKKTDASN